MQLVAAQTPLTRYGVLLTAILSALPALAIGFVHYIQRDAEAEATQGAMQKNAMASQIEYLAESARLQAQAIAAHPQTLACFEAGNNGACQSQAANLHALNRQDTLDFVHEGRSAGLLPGLLPDGTRRLLERAARQNSSTTTADFSMTVTQPVVNARNQRIGFVVLEQRMPDRLKELEEISY